MLKVLSISSLPSYLWLNLGSFGNSGVEAICGGVLRAAPAKHHHIFTPSQLFPMTLNLLAKRTA